jgi:hypothetical protein
MIITIDLSFFLLDIIMDRKIDYKHKYKKYKYKCNLLGGSYTFNIYFQNNKYTIIHGQWTSKLNKDEYDKKKEKFKEHPCIKNKISCNIENGQLVVDESYNKIIKIIQLSYFLFEDKVDITDMDINKYKHDKNEQQKIQIACQSRNMQDG